MKLSPSALETNFIGFFMICIARCILGTAPKILTTLEQPYVLGELTHRLPFPPGQRGNCGWIFRVAPGPARMPVAAANTLFG